VLVVKDPSGNPAWAGANNDRFYRFLFANVKLGSAWFESRLTNQMIAGRDGGAIVWPVITANKPACRAVILGLYLLIAKLPMRSQIVVPLGGNTTGRVYSIIPVGDDIWLQTQKGIFRVDRKGNQAVPVGGDTGDIYSIVPIGDDIWLQTQKGIFRVDRKGNQAVPVGGDTGFIYSIVPVGDDIWLCAEKGAFRIDRKGNQDVPVGGDTGRVFSIVSVGDDIWIGAKKGLFRVDRKGNQTELVGRDADGVSSIAPVGDVIWIKTGHGVFRLDQKGNLLDVKGDLAMSLSAVGYEISYFNSTFQVEDETWLDSGRALYRINRNGNHTIRLEGNIQGVNLIIFLDEKIWVAAENGAFRIDRKGNQPVRVEGDTGRVYSIVPIGDEIWLGAEKGAFQVNRKSNQAIRVGGYTGPVRSVVPVGNEVWLNTHNGAFRVDRHTKIRIELDGALPQVTRLWGMAIAFEGVTYPIVRYVDTQTGKPNYDSSQAKPIRLVYDWDKKNLAEKAKDEHEWVNLKQDGPPIELKPGWKSIYFSVRDGWGNQLETQSLEVWVIPTWTLSVLIPILSIGFCLVCLAFAPYVRYCHMLLMNPFLRNWASFGIVPLLVTTVPPLRRHLLRRYCRDLAQAPRFQSFASRYVVPEERFTLSKFAVTLSEHKVIGLHGQSGIGKSAFLTYLSHQCASREATHPLLRHLVPVFVDLSISSGLEPKVTVRNELRKHGDLTDDNLTEVLLDQGGFLFLFDGLNEVSEPASLAILQFADMHRNHNYSCLTAQVATDELRKVSTLLAGSPLSDDKIKELVRKLAIDPDTRNEKFDAESLLKNFTDDTYKICRVPLQLELVVEMWQTSGTLPKSFDGLYSYVLGPLMDKQAWSNVGHGDWPDVLSLLAFTMMTERRPYDLKKDYLPSEMKAELVTKKLLIDRGDVLEFRHDRVRAYLAANHFGLRWRTILTDEKTKVDANWDTMLEFHFAVEQDSRQTKDLLFLVVKKDMDAAIRLNSWGLQNRPELFKDWQDDFSREVGKTVLGGSQKAAVVSG
jgi:hypothetical protein